MKYYFGIDGGGTKTKCYIGNDKGEIIGVGNGGKANYQLCGEAMAKASIYDALVSGLKDAGIGLEEIEYGVFGLSGADEACDFAILNKLCKEICGEVPFEVLNDTWIGLRTGAEYGIVSICGTGAAHAGKNRKREKAILRNVDYETGNCGGGSELVSKVLHFAFRSNEGTYKKTRLENELLTICQVDTMDQLCLLIREKKLSDDMMYQIPVKTFELASENDEVALELIKYMGYTEGLYASALIKKLGMEKDVVPMVLIGSLFKTNHPVLIHSYMEAVKKVAPQAYNLIPDTEPVYGALLLAMEKNQ